ncbi:MAG: hypothetical protein OXI88_20710 [Gammaproteobacteria bacterium]|nr:hypothetical protein [Gammaproteobacteria bacterium]
MDKSQTARLPGVLLFIMALLAVLAATSSQVSLLWSGLAGWAAAVLLFRRLPRAMVFQVSGLLLVGAGCLAWVTLNGHPVDFVRVTSANIHIIALIASVTFLRLISLPGDEAGTSLPRGNRALVKTAWGLHVFATVINLSAVMLFGNRMEQAGKINRLQAVMFSRAFASGAYWSPFYVSIATALVYAPGSDFPTLMLAGLPVALAGLLITTWQLARDEEGRDTCGYPLRFEALFVPVLLCTAVILLHNVFPDFPILTLITVLSFLLALLMLAVRGPFTALHRIGSHIVDELPGIHKELMLFLAAGVMSVGISAVLVSGDVSLGLTTVSPLAGGAFILAAVLLSLIGVHPIITISILGSLVGNTAYNANLLGVCMLMMWGTSIVGSPLSGINLAIQGRFGVSSFAIMRWNAGYVLAMVLVCTMALYIYHYLVRI